MLQLEKSKLITEKRRLDDKLEYWRHMLCFDQMQLRDLIKVYDDLYDYSRVSVENGLSPLKDYYYHNP